MSETLPYSRRKVIKYPKSISILELKCVYITTICIQQRQTEILVRNNRNWCLIHMKMIEQTIYFIRIDRIFDQLIARSYLNSTQF